jgi:DNA helicase HerA-like ATPase
MSDDSSPDKRKEDLAIDEGETDDKSDDTQVSKPKTSRFANLEDISFDFIAYDQDICILGSKGSGKSYLANQLLKGLNGIHVWVYDFNQQFHSSRAIVFNDLTKMLEVSDSAKRGHYILQPHDNSENTFRRFCEEGFKRGNLVLMMDEAHSFLTKQKQLKEFNNIILSGRPRGISCITISSRPASLPNNVLTNAKHVFSFKLNLESDVKFLEGFLGSDVWVLLPPDKRHKLKDEPQLPEHTFFYRDMDTDNGMIGKV